MEPLEKVEKRFCFGLLTAQIVSGTLSNVTFHRYPHIYKRDLRFMTKIVNETITTKLMISCVWYIVTRLKFSSLQSFGLLHLVTIMTTSIIIFNFKTNGF